MSQGQCTKTGYKGKKSARSAAKRLHSSTGDPLRVYYCPDCRRWHLTSRLSKKKIRLKSKKQWVKRGRKPKPGQTLEELAAAMRNGEEG